MGETTVNCEVACRMCGWNIAGTIAAERASIEAIMTFVEQHWPEHGCVGTAGELLISWSAARSEAV
jgi:hypothetical protein